MIFLTRWLMCCLFLLSPQQVQETWGDEVTPEKQVQQDSEATAKPSAADIEKEKKKARTIGTLLLGLILFLGVMTIIFVVFWGKRMRRVIRRERASPTQPVDEFWYLQPDKNGSENTETTNEKSSEE